MQISEIFYNSPGPDHGSNASLNAEWVLLHNTSGSRITMTGWTLRDGGQKHTFTFGTYTIDAHGFVKITHRQRRPHPEPTGTGTFPAVCVEQHRGHRNAQGQPRQRA